MRRNEHAGATLRQDPHMGSAIMRTDGKAGVMRALSITGLVVLTLAFAGGCSAPVDHGAADHRACSAYFYGNAEGIADEAAGKGDILETPAPPADPELRKLVAAWVAATGGQDTHGVNPSRAKVAGDKILAWCNAHGENLPDDTGSTPIG